jgi:hypothetical protein
MRNIRGENKLSTLSRAGYGGEPAEPLTISLEAACLATSRRPPQEIMPRGECHHMRWPTRAGRANLLLKRPHPVSMPTLPVSYMPEKAVLAVSPATAN